MVVAAAGCFPPAHAPARTNEWLHCFNYPLPRQVSLLRHLELAGHADSIDGFPGLRFPPAGNTRVRGTCRPGGLLFCGPVLPSRQVRGQEKSRRTCSKRKSNFRCALASNPPDPAPSVFGATGLYLTAATQCIHPTCGLYCSSRQLAYVFQRKLWLSCLSFRNGTP